MGGLREGEEKEEREEEQQKPQHRDEGAVEAAEVAVGEVAEERRAEDGDCAARAEAAIRAGDRRSMMIFSRNVPSMAAKGQ